jgi:hypothetical protein
VLIYSGVHISLDEVSCKILKKPSIGQKKMIAHMNFPALTILNVFSQKNHGLVLWLVGLINAKDIGVAQPILL